MKFNLLILSISLLSMIACKDDDPQVVDCLPPSLQSGLVAFYPFHSGSLADESLQNNVLTNTTSAAPTADRHGNAACAFGFTNTGSNTEFLMTTQSAFLNGLNSFSVSLWYKPNDPSRDGGLYETLVGRGTGPRCPDRRGEWTVGLYDCRRAVFGHNNSVWADFTNDSLGCDGEVLANDNIWHHVVAVKSGNDYLIYFNGTLHDQVSGTANCGVGGTHLAQDIGDFFVGNEFTGTIDDILIYDRALSAQEVGDIHDLTVCCE